MSDYIITCYGELAMWLGNNVDSMKEIVRCRDCKYADETESGSLHCNGYLVADWDYYNDIPSDGVKVKPDGFCAWGERK